MRSKDFSCVRVSELVINWHVLEACNYRCRYCFAKWEKPAHPELWHSSENSERLLEALWDFFDPANSENPLRRSMEWKRLRLSLAGGEPTLLGARLVEIARKAHQLGFSVSLISNGSRLDPEWVQELAPLLSVIGLSLDAVDPATNLAIGRDYRGECLDIDRIVSIVDTARRVNPAIEIKINTVVNEANADTDLSALITGVRPDRWKVMRMLPMVTHALATDDESFASFINRHGVHSEVMCVEDNGDMTQSYVMVDPHGRFFQNNIAGAPYIYSPEILLAGAGAAFERIPFSPPKFAGRYAIATGGETAE